VTSNELFTWIYRGVELVAIGGVYFMLRLNDLQHLTREVREIARKLDEHIRWHMEQPR